MATVFTTAASVTLLRRLTWEGTIPLEIHVDQKELPAGSDRGLDSYFIQASRVSYLPLLIPEIKAFLNDLVFDDNASKMMKEEDWWFESEDGTLMKWHLPLGLLYDLHSVSTSTPFRFDGQSVPLKLILHLASPPTEKLLLSPSPETCKQAFMGQLKEADFLRWGSTKRVTGLRKQDQDGLWESIREHNFESFWRIASKVTPTTAPTVASPGQPPASLRSPSMTSLHSRPPSADPQSMASDRDGAYGVRNVPVRIYLPQGPVMQDVAPPLLEDGVPHTLAAFLHTHVPLLFPSPPKLSGARITIERPLAFALVQGVVCPGEAELGWLSACMSSADGWVNICIGLGSP